MKILLDECLPLDLRHRLPGHEVHTVQWAGFKGKKNGDLLSAAESAGYDAFVTVDGNIRHQQALTDRGLSIIVIRAATNKIDDLLGVLPTLLFTLETMQPGQFVVLG